MNPTPPKQPGSESPGAAAMLREGLSSVVIAFAMAFIAMGFVVRGFVIPTGSMAPTLLGAHVRLQDPETGWNWPVGPHFYSGQGRSGSPLPTQGTFDKPIEVHAPLSGPVTGKARPLKFVGERLRGGDRVFALRYLPLIAEPERFDPVVFAGQSNPDENVIKRLVGTPGEQIALVAGDAFVRRPAGEVSGWSGEGWRTARKPERLQRTLWSPIFDSAYRASGDVNPWSGEGWKTAGAVFTHSGSSSRLAWDTRTWPITDLLSHNEIPGVSKPETVNVRNDPRYGQTLIPRTEYGTGDLSVRANVRGEPQSLRLGVTADRHEFMGEMSAGRARVAMRAQGADSWVTLDERALETALTSDHPTSVEFWRVDQACWLFVDGRLVAGGPEKGAYEWSPLERARFTTGLDAAQIDQRVDSLTPGNLYEPGSPWIEVDGDAEFFRLNISRDIFWRPSARNWSEIRSPFSYLGLRAGRATHPSNAPVLGERQYFLCGDNSTDSEDGREWAPPHPSISDGLDSAGQGVVPREMIIGRAFIVYLPALRWRGVPIPDIGRVRWLP